MTHPLKGKLSIDVDDQIGLGNLASGSIEGRPILGAFFEPAMPGCGTAPRGDAQTLMTWRGFGGGRLSGLRFVPHNWDAFKNPDGSLKPGEVCAKICSDYITKVESDAGKFIGKLTNQIVDILEWDIETKNIPWQRAFLNGVSGSKGIRGANGLAYNPTDPNTWGYRRQRAGVWTFEGRQDTNTSIANEAANSGLLVGPQLYNGAMTEVWSYAFEIRTWVTNSNVERPNGWRIPIANMIPYTDAKPSLRLPGDTEAVLFATSRL